MADTEAIVRLAARAEDAADELLRERARLGSGAVGMQWKSSAASSFAGRAQDGADMLRRDADRLQELAAGLRRHARHVGDHLQVLADLEARAEQLAAQGIEAISGAAGSVGHAVGAVTSTVHAAEQAGGWVESHAPW